MTTSNEQAVKLPLMKRVVLALRGGVGGGVSAVLILLSVLLVIAIGVGGFIAGMALATKQNQLAVHNAMSQAHAAKKAEAGLKTEKTSLEGQIAELKDQLALRSKDNEMLKEQLAQAKMEVQTMDKVLGEIRESLIKGAAKPAEAKPEPPKGAKLRFGSRDCELGDGVKSKADVKCLNLREAIDAMNSKPGGYAGTPKPGDKPVAAPTPAPAKAAH
ncbi:hypothetical protein [Chitinimonas koreensis]|uniref:hypothetical protein n=1 Tax=Chitinimonas koreensis TaxID=356302 RepID=UPI00040D692A|nr:hypothetical protein [Chitinimonas koreensis]QNM97477.1 hypothetical protein H9L41_03995 [Chitinimonas koreensis]